MRNAAETLKRVTLELGGKSPNIVFADADLDAAVDGAMLGLFLNQGQCCCAGSRLFVEDKVYDEMVERLGAARPRSAKLGDPFDPTTEQGPQVDKTQFDKILGYIEHGQARRGPGASPAASGSARRATSSSRPIFADVKDDMKIATEEIFGPVHAGPEVQGRSTRSSSGPTRPTTASPPPSGPATSSKAHTIAERIRAGTVWINCYDVFDAAAPFGGFKASGLGRELGEKALDNYTELKTVTVALD